MMFHHEWFLDIKEHLCWFLFVIFFTILFLFCIKNYYALLCVSAGFFLIQVPEINSQFCFLFVHKIIEYKTIMPHF